LLAKELHLSPDEVDQLPGDMVEEWALFAKAIQAKFELDMKMSRSI